MKKLLLLLLLSPSLCAQVQIGKNVQIGGGGSGSGCAETVCVVNSPAGTQVVTQPGSTTLQVNSLNKVINAGTSLSTAITACGSANTTIQITQTIAVGSGITVPANCTLLFQSAGNLTGTSITINGPIQAARRQIIGAGLAVTLGPLTTEVPIEWFGGKADATGSVGVGTDNLAPFNLANGALSAGCITFVAGGYRFSGTPTFTKTNMCLSGITIGYPATAASISAVSSNLFIDSASADGPTFSSTATWGIIRDLTVLRTQTPTGTAKGVSINAGGVLAENLTIQDSIYNMYFRAANSYGTGNITNVSSGWGFTGLAGLATPNTCGYFVDTSGGVESASIRFFHDTAGSNFSGTRATGFCATGTNISDIKLVDFESAIVDYGIDLENTGTSNPNSQDIQIENAILNSCGIACIKINGIGQGADLGPHVYITGGNLFSTGTGAVGLLIQNSTNVSAIGIQFLAGSVGSAAQTDVVLNAVNGFQINDNDFSGASLINISCISSTNGTVVGNKIKNGNGTTGSTGIKNVGCTNVVEQANDIAGNGGTNVLNGITFDATSSGNGPWSLNTIDSATVTTPVTDAGTNNNPALIAGANVTITGKWPNQTIAASGAGAGTIIQANGTATTPVSPVNLRTGSGNGGVVVSLPSAANIDFNLSKPFTTGTNFTTGVASNTLNELAYFPGTDGRVADSTILITDVMQLSGNQTATGIKTLPSPVFTGTPTAPTAAPGTNTTQVATTAYTTAAVAALSTVYAPLTNPSGGQNNYAPIASPTFTGKATTAASTTAGAGLNLPHGIGPSSPVDGDFWTTISGLFGRINGVTNNFLMSASTLSASKLPKSNGGGSTSDSLYNDNGTFGTYSGTGGFSSPSLNSLAINVCPDTSGSGTAQTCVTTSATPFTPATGSCVTYTTTTTNSGAGLTLNVNSLGAKSIAIPGASGWTTTLTAGIILANKPMIACYDGTNWNVQQTGTAASGSGTSWSAITNPTGNLSLTFPSANTTTLTAGSATSTANFFTLSDTAANTGTGDLLKVSTNTTSAMTPFEVYAKTVSAFKVLATGETGATGKMYVNASSNTQGAGLYVGTAGIYSAAGQNTLVNGSSASVGTVLSLQNNGSPANNTGASLIFQVINSGFGFIIPASMTATATNVTSGSEAGALTFMNMNAGAAVNTLVLSGAGNAKALGGFSSGLMSQGSVATVASATTIAPVTPLVIVSGTTTVTTITAPSGTAALVGAWFDMITSSAVPFNTGGNIATSFTTTANTIYHCAFMGTTNGLWYCK